MGRSESILDIVRSRIKAQGIISVLVDSGLVDQLANGPVQIMNYADKIIRKKFRPEGYVEYKTYEDLLAATWEQIQKKDFPTLSAL